MKKLIETLIPNAPNLGLYVYPYIPADKRKNALNDYAHGIDPESILALYDATLIGNARDGAVFTADAFAFQNTDLEAPQIVRYEDLVRVSSRKRLLGGRKINFDVNRGRATVTLKLDFSGRPKAAEYIARFLNEAMIRSIVDSADAAGTDEDSEFTDVGAVRRTLLELVDEGKLSRRTCDAMLVLLEDQIS